MNQHIGTKCVQAGYRPNNGEPRQIPIVQSTTFRYESSEAMGKLFDLEAAGYFYTRLQNPTNDYVAAKIAALEGGTAGMLTSSGQAANFFSVFNVASAGDHVVSSASIYGGTFNLFNVTMRRMGIDFTFVQPDATEEELNAAFKPNTKAVFGETIANPAGCDIVTHSTTKYMDGHGAGVGGCIVDSGKFDWNAHKDKFPGLTTPDESYHGIVYTEKFGQGGAFITKCTAQLMRDFGSIQSPMNAFLLNLGLESLHLRMKRHSENGQKVAEWLEADPRVAWVNYPGLKSNRYYALAQKYLPNGSCGVVSFGVKGGRPAAEKFMANLKIAAIETHVADARSCVLHPANATHRQLSDEELAACGVGPDMIRLSLGIEDCEDLIADLDQALGGVKA